MKHETQMSNHLTRTQLLCEQISIIPNLSQWNLERQTRLENSVPQQEVGTSMNEKAQKKRRETNTRAKSEESPRDNRLPTSPKQRYRANILPLHDKWQNSVVHRKGWIIPSFTLKNLLSDGCLSKGKPRSHQCSSTLFPPTQDCLLCLLHGCSPNSSIKTQFHLHPYHQVSTSLPH